MPRKTVHLLLIIAAAIVPLSGVLTGGWSLREVVVLYWAENLVIGFLQLVRMVTVSPAGATAGTHAAKIALAAFFTVHYGIFCLVHGIFVFALTSGRFSSGGPGPGELLPTLFAFPRPFWVALGLIALNHLWTLVERWFLGGQFRSTTPDKLMAEPYKHIVVLHVGIIFGAFLSFAFGNPIGVLVIIVIGKFVIDLREVRREEREAADEGPRDREEG